MANLLDVIVRITGQNAGASTTIMQVHDALELVEQAVQAYNASIGALIQLGIETNASLETTTLQFKTLQGSLSGAQQHVQELYDFAAHTPFEVGPVIEASRTLEVFGGQVLDSQANLKIFGDAAAATNAPLDQLSFWIGRLYSELQAGRPIGESARYLQQLAVLSPEVRNQLEDMANSGKSGAETWAVFTQSLQRFAGAMEEQQNSWKGLTSTISDFEKLGAATVTLPFFKVLEDQMKGASAALQDPAFKETLTGLGETFGVVAEGAFALGHAFAGVDSAIAAAAPGVEAAIQVWLHLGEAVHSAENIYANAGLIIADVSQGNIQGALAVASNQASEAVGTLSGVMNQTGLSATALGSAMNDQLVKNIEEANKAVKEALTILGPQAAALEKARQSQFEYTREVIKSAEQVKQEKDAEEARIKSLKDLDGALLKATQSRFQYNIVGAQTIGHEAQQKVEKDQEEAAKKAAEAQKTAAAEVQRIVKEHWDRMTALTERGAQDVRLTYDRALEDERRSEDRNFQISETSWQDYYKHLDQQAKDAAESEIKARESVRDVALRAIDDQIQAARDEAEAQKRGIQDAEQAAKAAIQAQREAERQAHQAAIGEINDTRDARLADLDVQMQALNAQERLLKSTEQARKNSEDLQKAEQDLATARQKGTGIGAAQTALGDVQQRITDDRRQAQLDQQKRDLQDQQKQAKDDADAARKTLDDQQGAIQRQFADFNSFNVPGAQPGVNSDTAGALSGATGSIFGPGSVDSTGGVSPFELQKRAVDDALKTRLRALEAEKQGVTDTAQKDIDGLKARETATDRFYSAAETASQRYFTGEHNRVDDARRTWDRYLTDTRRSFDQNLQDMRYAAEHPGAAGAGVTTTGVTSAFGGTATPGARSPFASVGAAAGGGNVFNFTLNTTVGAGANEDSVGIVVRAIRDEMMQALLTAGLTS